MAARPQDARQRGPAAVGVVFQVKEDDENHHFSWLSLLAFLFLTYNTFLAISRSIQDSWAVSFAAVSYVVLLALFWCLRRFESAEERTRERLKVGVWTLATVLTAMFSYKVAAIMPLPVAVAVWALASATAIGGFCLLFVCGDRVDGRPTVDEKNPLKVNSVASAAAQN